jgi:hypothetical protein
VHGNDERYDVELCTSQDKLLLNTEREAGVSPFPSNLPPASIVQPWYTYWRTPSDKDDPMTDLFLHSPDQHVMRARLAQSQVAQWTHSRPHTINLPTALPPSLPLAAYIFPTFAKCVASPSSANVGSGRFVNFTFYLEGPFSIDFLYFKIQLRLLLP